MEHANTGRCSALNAGAPMIVIVVPSEAANDIGIRSFEAGRFLSRERSNVIGSITAVVCCDTAGGAGLVRAYTRPRARAARMAGSSNFAFMAQ